jgi:hypothetical protein
VIDQVCRDGRPIALDDELPARPSSPTAKQLENFWLNGQLGCRFVSFECVPPGRQYPNGGGDEVEALPLEQIDFLSTQA